jgi:hypothetical protein
MAPVARSASATLLTMLVVMAVILAFGAPAHAGTIASPFLFTAQTPTLDFLDCIATNVSAGPITSVTVEIIAENGAVLVTQTCSALPASAVCEAISPANGSFQAGYCRVTFTGAKSRIRASMQVVDETNNIKASLPAN